MTNSNFNVANLDGTNGFRFNTLLERFVASPFDLSNAGDVNNDGIDDVLISHGNRVYVVYGDNSIGTSGNVNLNNLNGQNGFVIDVNDSRNPRVSHAGDVNNDGIDDFILGADRTRRGVPDAAYVIFGNENLGSSGRFNLDSLDGSNGYVVTSESDNIDFGTEVSGAGDVNGDGFDDLLIGSPEDDRNGRTDNGSVHVLLGGPEVGRSGSVSLGSNGQLFRHVVLEGIGNSNLTGNRDSVSGAGDFNADGFDDIIVGSNFASPSSSSSQGGESYIIYGSADFGGQSQNRNIPTLDFDLRNLNGPNGLIVLGSQPREFSGQVSNLGDFDGDGIDDVLIGAPGTDQGSRDTDNGAGYIVYGDANETSGRRRNGRLPLDADLVNAIQVTGENAERVGVAVSSAGDVNGDGFDDALFAASGGESYVFFGGPSPRGPIPNFRTSLFNSVVGFSISPAVRGTGEISSAGDVNGDGLDDLLIAHQANRRDGITNAVTITTNIQVVFGNAAPVLDLNGVNEAGNNFEATFPINTFAGIFQAGGFQSGEVAIASPNLTITDQNSPTLSGATISIQNLQDGPTEQLSARTLGNITANYDASTGVLTLSGTDTIENYQRVLRSITYSNENPTGSVGGALPTEVRTIEFIIDDGGAHSNTNQLQQTQTTLTFESLSVDENPPSNPTTNLIEGDEGNNRLRGTGANDQINGGSGNDTLIGRSGSDNLLGEAGNDNLRGGGGNDVLLGGEGNDKLKGNNGNDFLNGGLGNDTLKGGRGDDLLFGGEGIDQLRGNAGADIFVLARDNAAQGSSLVSDSGGDRILDFQEGTDTIGLINGLTFSALEIVEETRFVGSQEPISSSITPISTLTGNTLIQFEGQTLATVVDVLPTALTAANFVTL
mgnify:CR=1 FL=1